MNGLTTDELARQIAVLEERMKTMAQESRARQAEYKTDITRLGERIEGLLGTDAAQRDAAAARRDAAAAEREITYKTDIARLGERIEGLGTEAAQRDAAAAEREITYKTDMARLGERIEGLRTEVAQRDTEAAKRETRLVLTVAVMLGLAVTILGYIN